MSNSTAAKTFQSFSDLKDGLNFFRSNLMVDGEVIHVNSSVWIENGKAAAVEGICYEHGCKFTMSRGRENEARKAIAWLLNEGAKSCQLECGMTVFVPQVFNVGI
jgi:hypothetical protein